MGGYTKKLKSESQCFTTCLAGRRQRRSDAIVRQIRPEAGVARLISTSLPSSHTTSLYHHTMSTSLNSSSYHQSTPPSKTTIFYYLSIPPPIPPHHPSISPSTIPYHPNHRPVPSTQTFPQHLFMPLLRTVLNSTFTYLIPS